MQAGFCCLESGYVRAKNSINVAIKNLVDFSVSGLLFWLIGFAVVFGTSWGGLIGLETPTQGTNTSHATAFLFYQLMFCGTATTIVSGAVAERMKFTAYLVVAVITAGVVYPLVGHWAWGGTLGGPEGWLKELGFVDFAGSTVVHSVGGWVALAALLVIGARRGRFSGQLDETSSHNLPLSTLGVFLLWLGWFGFNGGSAFGMTSAVPLICLNTALAGMGGGLAALAASWGTKGRAEVVLIMNGSLAGLVAITAGANAVGGGAALLIGGVGGLVCFAGTHAMVRCKLDDVVGAVAVHGLGGVWGTLAVGLFGDLTLLNTGLSRLGQVGVQLLGALSVAVWAFGLSYVLLRLIDPWHRLRVSLEVEERGLNLGEHEARIDVIDALATVNSNETRLRRILETAVDGIITINRAGIVESFNAAAAEIFGYTADEVIGQNVRVLTPEPIQPLHDGYIQRFIETGQARIVGTGREVTGRRKDGTLIPLELSINVVRQGSRMWFTGIVRDITRAKALQAELESLAITDPLTALYNRRYFDERLEYEFTRAERYAYPLTLMLLDIDNFKDINDRYGHPTGDRYLKALSTLLLTQVRDVDTVARYGGEELVVILPHTELEAANGIAERIRVRTSAMVVPSELGPIRRTVSIGIAAYTPLASVVRTNTETSSIGAAKDLLRVADSALYSAKRGGRDRVETARWQAVSEDDDTRSLQTKGVEH